jgi:hypothetical protein
MDETGYVNEIEDINELYIEEKQSIKFLNTKQKELFTSVVDYKLDTLATLITRDIIELSPRFQRRCRWDNAKKSKLIESFLMNVPVPQIFLNEDISGRYSIIDGKQRLTAIHEFLREGMILEGLDVFSDLNGKNFEVLPAQHKSTLQARAILRAVIILKQSDRAIKYEVFRRLNTGGVALNAQEIRNSVAPSRFNDLLLEVSENEKFHKLLNIKDKNTSKTYQTMLDVEFVLRYFTFRENWQNFAGGIGSSMDNFMDNNQKTSKEKCNEMRKDFLNTLDVVEACFGANAFKRYLPEKDHWRQKILASLYDAQMLACYGLTVSKVSPYKDKIINDYKKLFSNQEFRKTIDAGTNTPSFFIRRISAVKKIITDTTSN